MLEIDEDPLCLVAVPTFRRPHFLPRILACFERLDYRNKKMIIINDDPETRYKYREDTNVEIINIDKQVPLAVKRNLFNSWNYDIIFPLDDDDLFLPNRLKNHVTISKRYPDGDFFRNDCFLFVNSGSINKMDKGSSFTNSSFTRNGYFKSGGYTNFNKSNHDDQSIRKNFATHCKMVIFSEPDMIDFVYQFEGNRYHNSYNEDPIMSESIDKETIGERTLVGDINLEADYENYDNIVSLCNKAIKHGRVPVNIMDKGVRYSEVENEK
jgi:glycosyltransferase involved in cell wall biosynthesis